MVGRKARGEPARALTYAGWFSAVVTVVVGCFPWFLPVRIMVNKRETAAFRDQQADAMASVNDHFECNDEQCTESARWKYIKREDSGWQVSNDPDVPLLCPACRRRVERGTITPSEAREELNRDLTEFVET